MCGFVGFLEPGGLGPDADETVRELASRLAHRGPDDADVWFDPGVGVALGFRRLAIIDLSAAGRQPMVSASGRYVLTFNGEIYNHQDLRSELLTPETGWRGHSDTETLLAGFERWGVEATLRRAVGMFAFALWDREERELTLARDRMGEKPCYYGSDGRHFLFGSELKALRTRCLGSPSVDRGAVALYLRYGYVPAQHAIYQGFHKLLPGTFLRIAMRERVHIGEPQAYWSLLDVADRGQSQPFQGDDEEAKSQLEDLLRRSVREQSIADVPLGAFLSGGIDSSTVVALMQAQATRPVKTFTIGFEEQDYDESGYARAVARHLGTDHTELRVTPADSLAVIDKLPSIFDEPFADMSAIPTYLVAGLARREVTVSLSGDAGDELFAGYDRYHRAHRMWKSFRAWPRALRSLGGGGLDLVPAEAIGALMVRWSIGRDPRLFARRLGTLRAALAGGEIDDLYREQVSMWPDPTALMQGQVREPDSILTDPSARFGAGDDFHRLMYTDSLTYLPDDILTKVDRTAMAVSLETRVPLLDHRVVEFAWSLPLRHKVRDGRGKWLLRQVLRSHVPDELVERPKMGFGVPLGAWFRGPLRDWCESALAEDRLRTEGYLEPTFIRQRWREHLSGSQDWSYGLWQVLMFQQWLNHAKEPEVGRSSGVRHVEIEHMGSNATTP